MTCQKEEVQVNYFWEKKIFVFLVMKRFELPVYDKPLFENTSNDAEYLRNANMTSLIELIDQLCIDTFYMY